MAIQKDLETKFGVTANYCRVWMANFENDTQILNLGIKVWKDQDAYNDGAAPMKELNASVPILDVFTLVELGTMLGKIETYLVTNDENLQGGQIVLDPPL